MELWVLFQMVGIKLPIFHEFFSIFSSRENPNNYQESTKYENSIRRFQKIGPTDILLVRPWIKTVE